MKIVLVGGSGLIGRKLAPRLVAAGHTVTIASPSRGVDAVRGTGLAEALAGAHTVVDVSNAPSFEDAAVLHFFETGTRRLLAAEAAAGVRHHLALSVVGCDRVPDSGYLRAKAAQEALIRGGPLQPVAADDVAALLAERVERGPLNGVVDLAGPEAWGLDALVRQALAGAVAGRRTQRRAAPSRPLTRRAQAALPEPRQASLRSMRNLTMPSG
ncbi:SDR family oxidoreductase [Piscinibacter sakaiensis]|uniref:SDR family oxidoreductase n=1 Tax=Piscinibacter sakaiensis TaxID=1547922 RepID=UPI00372BD2F8